MGWAEELVNIFHFRDKRKNEVDIVLEQDDGKLIGIEVKASGTVGISDFRGLRKLAELADSNFDYGVVFYTGSKVLPFAHEGNRYFAIPISIFWI